MISVRLINHGVAEHDAEITVETIDGDVDLCVKPEDDTEPRVLRTLTPAEARALAAALIHYAAEAKR